MKPSQIHWTRSYTEFSISELEKAIAWLEACAGNFPEAGYRKIITGLEKQKEKLEAILATLPKLWPRKKGAAD